MPGLFPSLISLLGVQFTFPSDFAVSLNVILQVGAVVPPWQCWVSAGESTIGSAINVGGSVIRGGMETIKIVIKPRRRSAKSQPDNNIISCLRERFLNIRKDIYSPSTKVFFFCFPKAVVQLHLYHWKRRNSCDIHCIT